MFSNLDVIQESFEDVPLEYNTAPSNHFYGLNGQRRSNNYSQQPQQQHYPNSNSASSLALAASESTLSLHNNNNIRTNYSNPSLATMNNNNSKELLLTPSQRLKIIKKQRSQKSQDQLSTNSPENLNAIDFLSDDELPDYLIVYDVPSLYSLQTLSHNKNNRARKPSIRRQNSLSSIPSSTDSNNSIKSDNVNGTITNTNNITSQIENSTSYHNSTNQYQHHSNITTNNNNSNNQFPTKSLPQSLPPQPNNLMAPHSYSISSTSTNSSPATRASSIFSRTSDISNFSSYYDDDYLNPLSSDVKLLSENKDFKLEEALQRMSMLKNMSHVSNTSNSTNIINNRNSTTSNKSNPNDSDISLASSSSLDSSSKNQYLSATRQSNLPPKSKYEILKHEKDYQNILELEIHNEKEKLKKYQSTKKKLLIQNEKDEKLWNKVIKNYDVLVKLPQTRELWWRNVSDKYRSKIWKRQLIGKKNIIFEDSVILKALTDAKSVLDNACNFKSIKDELIKRKKGKENPQLLEDIQFIEKCAQNIQYSFVEMKYFQYGENFDLILEILIALKLLKNQQVNSNDTNKLKFVDIFKSVNLVCIFSYIFDDHFTILTCLVSLLSKKLPNIMLSSNDNQIPLTLSKDLEIETLNSQSLYLKDIKNQFDKYLLQLIPQLYNHFIQRDINSLKIIQGLTTCVFSNQLSFDLVLRIIDIYLFEGDIFLLRTALALLKKVSFKLYGDKDEVYSLLKVDGLNNSDILEVGEVDEFIHDIRDVLKKK